MISETTHSSPTKLIGLNLHVGEQGIGYSNLTPDPRGGSGVKKKKKKLAPLEELGKTREAGFLVFFYMDKRGEECSCMFSLQYVVVNTHRSTS